MIRVLARRLVEMAFTLLAVFTVTFFLVRAVPGGPYSSERKLPIEVERNMRARYKLDDPISVQYGRELGRVLRGDLGMSYRKPDFSVNQMVEEGFRVSAALGILALWFAISVGTTVGVLSAVRRGSAVDVGLTSLVTLGVAVPNFIVAGLAIMLFSFAGPHLPPAGWGSAWQLILPCFCLGLPYAAYIARLTRTGMLEVLGRDYIRTARAKGLSETTVVLKHALKGALLPVVSFLGPAAAGLLSGSVVVERIFALPGLGSHFVDAAQEADYTVVLGLTLVYAVLLCTLNLLVDLCYSWFDPRIQAE